MISLYTIVKVTYGPLYKPLTTSTATNFELRRVPFYFTAEFSCKILVKQNIFASSKHHYTPMISGTLTAPALSTGGKMPLRKVQLHQFHQFRNIIRTWLREKNKIINRWFSSEIEAVSIFYRWMWWSFIVINTTKWLIVRMKLRGMRMMQLAGERLRSNEALVSWRSSQNLFWWFVQVLQWNSLITALFEENRWFRDEKRNVEGERSLLFYTPT
jgi:hypothetical protein